MHKQNSYFISVDNIKGLYSIIVKKFKKVKLFVVTVMISYLVIWCFRYTCDGVSEHRQQLQLQHNSGHIKHGNYQVNSIYSSLCQRVSYKRVHNN